MPHAPLDSVLRHVRQLAVVDPFAEMSDQYLLQRFAEQQDEAAFAQLVQRHGTLVLGVCQRVLHDPQAADDAFQATFLALARRPTAIRQQTALASWLHRVAYRAAQRARYRAARRQTVERQATVRVGADPQAEMNWREMCEVLEAEMQALPDGYRSPLVLCFLEGKTRDEAAQQLGCSVAAVKGRLERGRAILRSRLTRRGITLSAGLLATLITQNTMAALPGQLAVQTARCALSFASGKTAGLAAAVCGLANGLLRDLALTRLKTIALVLLLGLVTVGVGAWMYTSAAAPGANPPLDQPLAQAPVQQPPKAPGPKAGRTDRHGDPLPPFALARLGTIRFRNDGPLFVTALSPNGRILAGGGKESVLLWDAETGRPLHRSPLLKNGSWVDALAFTPDSKLVGSYDHAMQLRIIDSATGKTVKVFDRSKQVQPRKSFTSSFLAFLAGGKQLLIKDAREAIVHLLDAQSGGEIRAFRSEGNHLYGVALSNDGQKLAVAEDDGVVRLWEVATGKSPLALPKHSAPPQALCFAPQGKMLATGDESVTNLWDTTTGKLVHTLEAQIGSVQSLDFAPDGKTLLANHGFITVQWDIAAQKEIRRLNHDSGSAVRFLADGQTVFVGPNNHSGQENTCHFLDLATGKESRRFDGHNRSVKAIAFAPDGKYVATGEDGGHNEIRVWEVSTGRVVLQNKKWGRGRVSALVFSPQGDVLASGHGKSVLLWDLKTGKLLRTFPGHQPLYHAALAFSTDGSRLASGGGDGTIRVWDTASARELQNLRIDKVRVWTLAFSPDLRWAAIGDQDLETILLWDLATGKEWKRIPRRGSGGVDLAFSPDGRTLLEGSGTSQLFLLEVASDQLRRTIDLPAFATPATYSPDGRRIAVSEFPFTRREMKTPGARAPIHIFDMVGNRRLATLAGHESMAHALRFSPDNRVLASGSTDTTALLWDVAALDNLQPAVPLTAEQRTACWNDLGGGAEQAYSSMWKLAEDKGTVELLRKEMPAAAAPAAAKVVSPLLADLDSDQFAVRSRAHDQLGKLGATAEEQLRKALTGQPRLELRQRVQNLLAAIERQRLHFGRGIEVLEAANTLAARQLLEALGRGAADAWLTREAQESLARLNQRPARLR